MLDPSADNTDVYAWTAPGAEGALTLVANWIPGEVPANGPNFFRFDDPARYYNNIDNTGDGVAGHPLPVRVRRPSPQPELVPVRGSRSEQVDDPKLNVVQRYDSSARRERPGS